MYASHRMIIKLLTFNCKLAAALNVLTKI